MSAKILQINYRLNGPRAERERENLPYAQPIADLPGLRWKFWIRDKAQKKPVVSICFDGDTEVRAFLDGPIIAEMKGDPTLSIKTSDVIAELTTFTCGPVAKILRSSHCANFSRAARKHDDRGCLEKRPSAGACLLCNSAHCQQSTSSIMNPMLRDIVEPPGFRSRNQSTFRVWESTSSGTRQRKLWHQTEQRPNSLSQTNDLRWNSPIAAMRLGADGT